MCNIYAYLKRTYKVQTFLEKNVSKQKMICNQVASVHWHITKPHICMWYLSIQNFLKRFLAREYIPCGGKGQCYTNIRCKFQQGSPALPDLFSGSHYKYLALACLDFRPTSYRHVMGKQVMRRREALHGDEEHISLSQEWLAYLYYLVHQGLESSWWMKGGWW